VGRSAGFFSRHAVTSGSSPAGTPSSRGALGAGGVQVAVVGRAQGLGGGGQVQVGAAVDWQRPAAALPGVVTVRAIGKRWMCRALPYDPVFSPPQTG
jgi:hypothetical protein